MELTLFFMKPLPSGLPWSKAIKFVGHILYSFLTRAFKPITAASKDNLLSRTVRLNPEFDDLVNPSTLLATERYLAFPEPYRLKFEILTVYLLEGLNRRLHLPFELEKYVAAEPFTQLTELFYQTAVICC